MRKPTTILLISAVIIFLAEVYIAGWFNAFWTWAFRRPAVAPPPESQPLRAGGAPKHGIWGNDDAVLEAAKVRAAAKIEAIRNGNSR